MARILIVGGGCRGRELARELVASGHAVRISTRSTARRPEIESTGAECIVGTPHRLETLRHALDQVTIACWLLALAGGPSETLRELHAARLEAFVRQTIDSTVRGFVYESGAGASSDAQRSMLGHGEALARELCARNAIPLAVLSADPASRGEWLREVRAAVALLLGED
jgi:uncharacterized protein YbjT (DUF2867 family)